MVLLKTTAGTRQHLRRILSKEDFQKMECRTRTTAERTFLRVKTRHENKLKGLMDNSPSSKPGKGRKIATNPKWVTNLSTHQLSEEQKEVLSLGLNFVPTPRRIPVKEIAASLEEGAKKLDEIPASEMRNRLCGILRRAKTPANNMTRQQMKAVRELKAMDDVVILPADKGNSTVVMEKEEYSKKMMELLNTDTYEERDTDPTNTLKVKINRILKTLETKGEITTQTYQRIRASGSQSPRIYGLPKIHKANTPLRPIVSCINSPTYKLSRFIAKILSPLVGSTDSFVMNTGHFVEMMRDEKLGPDEMLVSFDVSSLFTNVPIQEAVQVIKKKLKEDQSLPGRTSLTAHH